MTEADIDRIIAEQGCTSHIDVRVTTKRGDGTTRSYVYLRKQGLRRPIHLASVTKLLKMSEADLVQLITTKTAKSAQSTQLARLEKETNESIVSLIKEEVTKIAQEEE